MHDEFLHRLRKEPKPEFAARLRAHLRHQPVSPPRPRALSRARTLLTVLLLGGTAFAVTSMVMRGLPQPVLVLYQRVIARIGAGTPAHRVGSNRILEGLQWGASWASLPRNSAQRGEPNPAAAASGSAPASPTSAGVAASHSTHTGEGVYGSPPGGLRLLTSWAAYPHAEAAAGRVPQLGIHVFFGNSADWRDWPQTMCGSKASTPDMALTFEPVATVGTHPCPPPDSRTPSSVIVVPLGYEAVVLARSPLYGAPDLTRRELFLALAKWVPDPARPGTVRQNASSTWRQIDPAQGPEPIQIMGSPLSSETGRSMIELLMEAGCNTYPWIEALKSTAPDKYARICRTVRTDGVYTEVPNLQASELLAEPNALGILGFSDLAYAQGRNLALSRLDGVMPTQQDIESGTYPGSRGMYLYINRSRTPRYAAFAFFVPFGFSRGAMVALSTPQRRAAFAAAAY